MGGGARLEQTPGWVTGGWLKGNRAQTPSSRKRSRLCNAPGLIKLYYFYSPPLPLHFFHDNLFIFLLIFIPGPSQGGESSFSCLECGWRCKIPSGIRCWDSIINSFFCLQGTKRRKGGGGGGLEMPKVWPKTLSQLCWLNVLDPPRAALGSWWCRGVQNQV